MFEVVAGFFDLALLKQAVGGFAVVGDGDAAAFGHGGESFGVVVGQGEVVHLAAFGEEALVDIPVVAGGGLPCVDADFLAAAEGFEDLVGAVEAGHFLVDEAGEVGAGAEGVGAADESGAAVGAEGEGGERCGGLLDGGLGQGHGRVLSSWDGRNCG